MARFTQAGRELRVQTPLGKDVLLLVRLQGQEALSRLFSFTLDLLAENSTKVEFEKLMGQKITVTLTLPDSKTRYFHGICTSLSQGERDTDFTSYRMEIAPQLWLLTRITQSRIFQYQTVPEILQKILAGLDVGYEIMGTFEPRDYCAQYRETDFNFASRLMEEEGLYYFFKQTAQGHQMVVANTPQSHPDVPEHNKVVFDPVTGGTREGDRIFSWEKTQALRSGKYLLWDHCFELPHKHLESEQKILDSVQSGKVTHKLKLGSNEKLELYDYPGAYAQRFDGVDKGGGDQASELQKIFEDNRRTVAIRMQQEAVPGLETRGTSNCRHLMSGHKFTLERHFDADGPYVLTRVEHSAKLSGDFRSGGDIECEYESRFTCIPAGLPFRPVRVTPKPVVQGSQTAVVVGPAGEEIFTDKYGRVKVQFHWDREGQYDSNSSCWVRVGTPIAGRQWGMIHIPRIGQEVIVDFLEGDPDCPIIVGTVYNADQMPPYTLPDHKTKSTYKSYSSLGGGGFNEIRFEDKKGEEQVFVHAEKSLDVRVKGDRREFIGNDRHLVVKRDRRQLVKRNDMFLVKQDRVEELGRDHHLKISGKQAIEVTGSRSLKVCGDVAEVFSANHSEEVGGDLYLKAMNLVVEGATGITLKVGGSSIVLTPGGIWIQGSMVHLNSGSGPSGTGTVCSLVPPAAPDEALIADNADPGDKAPTYKNQPVPSSALTHDPGSEENRDKKSWIEIELVDEEGNPVPGERYEVTLPDGSTVASGTLDERGFAHIGNTDPGTCKITFPDLDKDAWEPK